MKHIKLVSQPLTPVTLTGVVVPNAKAAGEQLTDYKLVCASGVEYYIVADAEWRKVLETFSWEEVNVIGLLNVRKRTIVPQKIYPKGPTGERENVIELADWRNREFAKKMVKVVTELVLVPAAIIAMMA